MASNRRAAQPDADHATTVVLAGLASGIEVAELVDQLRPLHPNHDTFPGEVFLSLAVDALDIGSFTRDEPLDYPALRQRLLPEIRLRGRADHHKSFYTLMTPPALRGGLAPDLLEEVRWWNADDYWEFALYALIVYIRAAAERLQTPVSNLCAQIAEQHGIRLN